MIQVQNMQQPAQGVTAELYSQVEDYLALGKPGVENETSTQKSSTRKVIKKSSSKSTSSSGSVENTDEWTLGVKVNGKTIYGDAAEIVGRMVEAEMGASFQEEALKAQAVAAYTYVRYHNENGSCPQVVAKDDVSDKVEDAVNEVIGQAIYYDGEYIDATYCASNAGQSMDAEHVWGGYLPYLVSVETVSYTHLERPLHINDGGFLYHCFKLVFFRQQSGNNLQLHPAQKRKNDLMGDGIHLAAQKRVSIRKLRKSVQQPFSLRCRFRRNRRPQHGEGVLTPPFTREPGWVP